MYPSEIKSILDVVADLLLLRQAFLEVLNLLGEEVVHL